MDITITLGWWLLPTAITICALVVPFLADDQPRGYMDIGNGIVGAFQLLIGIAVSLFAWLIWSVWP